MCTSDTIISSIPSFILFRHEKTLIFATPFEGISFKMKGKHIGSVVQLVRMPPCHGGGRGFESRPVRRESPQSRINPCIRKIYRGFLLPKLPFFFHSSNYPASNS